MLLGILLLLPNSLLRLPAVQCNCCAAVLEPIQVLYLALHLEAKCCELLLLLPNAHSVQLLCAALTSKSSAVSCCYCSELHTVFSSCCAPLSPQSRVL
jgi:hypothetical protein